MYPKKATFLSIIPKSKNVVKKDVFYSYEVTEKEGTNKPKTVVKKLTGASTPEGTIKYTYY